MPPSTQPPPPQKLSLLLADTASRFATLARKLNLLEVDASENKPDAEHLASTLDQLLLSLSETDMYAHRHKLLRSLAERLRAALAPILDEASAAAATAATASTASASALAERCAAQPSFERMMRELVEELHALEYLAIRPRSRRLLSAHRKTSG